VAATVIGSGITIEGEVSSSEEVVVAGTIRGKLDVAGQVTVESEGVVEADIEAQTVAVGGSVTGNVSVSDRVDLLAGARLVGDVKAARLTIADGAVFKGNVDMDA
jgi:cytoskeletal protein CcmA (bactofilin family)